MKGRDTSSRDQKVASLYIAAEFKKYGLTPTGDNGTFMQRVDFVQANIEQSSIRLSTTNPQGDVKLKYPK